jgi:hypothetical protein
MQVTGSATCGPKLIARCEIPELSGIRHVGGAKLNQALVWNVRTCSPMPREKAQAAPTARLKVPMRQRGADVVVTKRGNARGAKGVGHRPRWRAQRLNCSGVRSALKY